MSGGCETAKQPLRLSIEAIVQADMKGQSMHIPIDICPKDQAAHHTKALIDSGASGMFISEKLVRGMGLKARRLPLPIPVYNVDGTSNKLGEIKEAITLDLEIEGQRNSTHLFVTGLGKNDLILGMTWLRKANPVINWEAGTLRLLGNKTPIKETRKRFIIRNISTDFIPVDNPATRTTDDEVVVAYSPETREIVAEEIGNRTIEEALTDLWIQTKVTVATTMAQGETEAEHTVPSELADYIDVFEKKKSKRFPPSRSWDHAINLKENFVLKDYPMYPIALAEEKVLKEFIEENLRKGYIRPSKSPITSSFFFVGKKDGTLRPCQDYRYLNEGTIEDRYPVPNTSDVINQLTGSSIFTKFDLRA